MNEAYLAIVRAQMENLTAPSRYFQRLMIDHAERLAALQTEALRGYTQIAMEQMRAMMAVMSPADPADIVARQREALGRLNDRFDRDSRTSAGPERDVDSQAARLVPENVIFLDRLR